MEIFGVGLDHEEIGFGASPDQPFGTRDERPGLLILADDIYNDDAALLSRAAGLRLLGTVSLDQASNRLDVQIGCDIILCFCPSPDPMVERLLVQIETLALQNDMPVILVADLDTIDLAYACLRSGGPSCFAGRDIRIWPPRCWPPRARRRPARFMR